MKSKIFLALALISLGAYSCVSPKKLQEAETKYGELNGAYADLQSKYRDAQDATSKAKNDADKIAALYKVDGLYGVVKKHYPHANEKESALLMEFVLHGLSSYSIISKKMIDGKIEFNDMMGSMINLGDMGMDDDAFNDYA